jgi:hypothetical protein
MSLNTESEQDPQNRLLFNLDGKPQQQTGGKRLIDWWENLLLSFSTGFEQEPQNLLTLHIIYHLLRNGLLMVNRPKVRTNQAQ